MKILFYLPVVTPWWFTELVLPLIRSLHGKAELHVMIAPIWRNTGLEGEHLAPLADLDQIQWHIIDEADPELFRCNAAAIPGLVELVHEIAPDLTLARSADFATPALFPGLVRFLMEGWLPPYGFTSLSLMLERQPFRLGIMPEGAGSLIDTCAEALGNPWNGTNAPHMPALPQDWHEMLDLPTGSPILAVPLHYEHEENFFLMHSRFPKAVDLIRHLLCTVDENVFLAVSDHPLNRKYVDRSELKNLIDGERGRVRLCELDSIPGGASGVLAAHADAVLIEMSKAWALAAYSGTSTIHLDGATSADWLRSTALSDPAISDWTGTRLPVADRNSAERYFGWHFSAGVFDPHTVTLDRLMLHVHGEASHAIIESNIAVLHAHVREAA